LAPEAAGSVNKALVIKADSISSAKA